LFNNLKLWRPRKILEQVMSFLLLVLKLLINNWNCYVENGAGSTGTTLLSHALYSNVSAVKLMNGIIQVVTDYFHFPSDCRDCYKDVLLKFKNLRESGFKTVLVHVHVPKAGGTALALALSSHCTCNTSKRIGGSCIHCHRVVGNRGQLSRYGFIQV
jgi:hypothetical protein